MTNPIDDRVGEAVTEFVEKVGRLRIEKNPDLLPARWNAVEAAAARLVIAAREVDPRLGDSVERAWLRPARSIAEREMRRSRRPSRNTEQ